MKKIICFAFLLIAGTAVASRLDLPPWQNGGTYTGDLTAPNITATYAVSAASSSITIMDMPETTGSLRIAGSRIITKSGILYMGDLDGAASNVLFRGSGGLDTMNLYGYNVGIGTATPQGLLTVGAGSTPALRVNSDGNITSSGKLNIGDGLGTPHSSAKLILSTTTAGSSLSLQLMGAADSNEYIFFGDVDSATQAYLQFTHGSNVMKLVNGGNENIILSPDGKTYFNGGNVGISSSTPMGLLTVGAGSTPALVVNSNGNIDMLNNFGLRGAITTGAYNSILKMNDSNNIILNNSYQNILFSVTSGKYFNFQTGNVGISSATPQGLLTVGDGSTPTLMVTTGGIVKTSGEVQIGGTITQTGVNLLTNGNNSVAYVTRAGGTASVSYKSGDGLGGITCAETTGYVTVSTMTVAGGFYPKAVASLPTSDYTAGAVITLTPNYLLYISTETVVGTFSWVKVGVQ